MNYPNIEAERVRHGLSKEGLAAKLGVCRKTLYNWTSRGRIPQEKIIQMSIIFNCSIDYLLSIPTRAERR